MKYRTPVVAGSFYPGSPEELRRELASFLSGKPAPDIQPKALIVPHAGYCYSGAVAASAYGCLKNAAKSIRRVILLGPSHRVALGDCVVPSHDAFTTPLGIIPLDREGCQRLLNHGLVRQFDQAHRWEHSLEVQLPFLQDCLNDFEILPIVVGSAKPEAVARVLDALSDLPDSLFIISTDLSHYHPYHQAQQLDEQSIARILELNDDLQPQDACGCYALNGLLHFCRDQGWQIRLVNQANSGDASGSKDNVVGYASFVLY